MIQGTLAKQLRTSAHERGRGTALRKLLLDAALCLEQCAADLKHAYVMASCCYADCLGVPACDRDFCRCPRGSAYYKENPDAADSTGTGEAAAPRD
jgi:hypothetical protein